EENPPHKLNEKVLVRLKDKQYNIPRRHYATKGHVIKPYLVLQRYKIRFQSPNSNEHIVKWFSVNYVTSITREKEIHHDASPLQYHQRKYHIQIIHDDRLNSFQSQGLSLRLDSRPDGNCQFEAMADQLRLVGIYRSAETLRCDIVNDLVNHPFAADVSPLTSYILGDEVDEYLA
ncbi:hypothetical protein LSAT2_002579, partial [Lamellibrachia satsuma]